MFAMNVNDDHAVETLFAPLKTKGVLRANEVDIVIC